MHFIVVAIIMDNATNKWWEQFVEQKNSRQNLKLFLLFLRITKRPVPKSEINVAFKKLNIEKENHLESSWKICRMEPQLSIQIPGEIPAKKWSSYQREIKKYKKQRVEIAGVLWKVSDLMDFGA